MAFVVNDRWRAVITLPENAFYEVSFLAWRDLFGTWRSDTAKKLAAGVDIGLELEEGRRLIETALAPTGSGSRAEKAALRDALKRDKALKRDGDRFMVMGDPEVVAVATDRCASNDDDGVATVLAEALLTDVPPR